MKEIKKDEEIKNNEKETKNNKDIETEYYEVNKNIKKIEPKTELKKFLMDDKQGKEGQQVREIYKKLISIQNDFLTKNINALKKHIEILPENDFKKKQIEYLLKQISYNVKIQNVNEKEIIDIENNLINLENLINYYSKRKCIKDDLTIDYNNYNEIEINYELIEDEIRKNLLYGKKLFSNNLNYIRYNSEFSSIINEFVAYHPYTKYTIEKEKISNSGIKKNILPNLNKLMFYISHNQYDDDELAMKALENTKKDKITKFENEFIKFINENEIKIKQLPGLYDYIEEELFNDSKNDINFQEDSEELNGGSLTKLIKEELIPLLKNKTQHVNEDNLLRALRKFINKNLKGKNKIIDESNLLLDELLEDDGLWLIPIEEREDDFQKINDLFEKKKNILIMHSKLFYENLIGKIIYKK